MIEKKSSKADLESRRGIFVEIGLVISLALVLVAFEWKTYEKKTVEVFQRQAIDIPEEMVEITKQETPQTPPPPPQQVTVLNIVEDDVDIETDFTIDAEATQSTVIQEYVPVQNISKEDEQIEEQEIFTIVESMPEFPGGEEARMKFLLENIKYPQIARESGIQGVVYVTFVVEPDGSITNVKIIRGIGGGCDEEAVRVVKMMPKWIPGNQRGKPVRVQFNMPIKFTLQ
ncbi:MAG: Protein containing TonB, C-terminal domain [Bacteroidetes bacterium 38_7]|nr:MAG: Protein containing TonB, C-terminal domain [Bacteroidetes bacterium 38_7]HAL65317.1 energy transducer TonB [Bacteroidales bacterium]